jgi:osmotically-inducible protein OsmY
MINTVAKTDLEIENDVLSELTYEPSVKVTDIGVLVKDGTVTLNGDAINLALKHSAIVDVDQIQVKSEGNKVVLRGEVRSFTARDEAERIAWSEPCVSSVDNHLGINWSSIVE